MGKCVSKHPSVLTIALSEKDLANANQIWSKFGEGTEYMPFKDDAAHQHGNQLCEHESSYFVNATDGVREQQSRRRQQQQNSNKEKKSSEWTLGSVTTSLTPSLLTTTKTKTKTTTVAISEITSKCEHHDDDDDDDDAVTVLHFDLPSHNAAVCCYAASREGDDRRHDNSEYDDATECTCHDGNNNANISQNDGQLCLPHLHLLQEASTEILMPSLSPTTHTVAQHNQQANEDAANNFNWRNSACDKYCKHEENRNIDEDDGMEEENHVAMFDDNNSFESRKRDISFQGFKNSDYYHQFNGYCEGQTESKKNSKKHNPTGVETKGTAMSFGFRKKLNSTPKKLRKLIEGSSDTKSKHDKCNNTNNSNDIQEITFTTMETMTCTPVNDNNGNPEIGAENKARLESVPAVEDDTQKRSSSGVSTPKLPGANNRFGFRGIMRPASTGNPGRYDVKENALNNNCVAGEGNETKPIGLVSNLKRRSKSAHAGQRDGEEMDGDCGTVTGSTAPKITQPKTLTFNLSHNSTIEYQRQQFFQQPASAVSGRIGRFGAAQHQHQHQHQHQYQPQLQVQGSQQHSIINTGMHTNVIVRPTPRAPPASFSKFTLHTTSLPKPEFPIAISLSTTTTPTTPGGGTFSPVPFPMTNATSAITTTTASGARTRETAAQHPLTAVAAPTSFQHYMDPKAAKHVANSTTRRGFSGSREISADSGISSMDIALDSSASSGRSASPPKRSRSRPRNLQMVMNGRHKFEVRDMDDPLSSESSSIVVESLALPKLPNDSQTIPLPLSGLVRSNTFLSRELNESLQSAQEGNKETMRTQNISNTMGRHLSDDSEGREEKLYLDRSASEKANKLQYRDLNTCSSKTSSPGSSIMTSWCNAAGEALATQGSSIMNSITINDDSNKTLDRLDSKKTFNSVDIDDLQLDLNDEDFSTMSTDMNISPMSSNYEPVPSFRTYTLESVAETPKLERPKSFCDTEVFEKKFAEMALAGSKFLIDDETSPTDSLVSSTTSDEAGDKKKKSKINSELQEKDIDEISPELEEGSPISPGSPTHASRSLSLSDCGNLIDDEIADQPALLFNTESQPDGLESITSRRDKTDTPTLMESASMRSLKGLPKLPRTALQHAIELSLRTPLSLRKKVMEHAESLDTLSPCESICSDDLMMDFEMNSSIDSIDHSASIKSRSGSDLHKIDETELYSELERQGSDLMKELDTMLRTQQNNRERDKNRVIAHLPVRATRLLNRSRLQQQCNYSADSPDSAKSSNSLRRVTAASSRASSNGSMQHKQLSPHMQRSHRDSVSSSDDLMLYDKSFRNAMIQDVLHFKKQLLRLRRILQEDETILCMTETIDPFDTERQQTLAAGFDLGKDAELINLISSSLDEPIEDLNDLRRQVVYLQGQIDDRDRTIRLQKEMIEKLEAEKKKAPHAPNAVEAARECINTATQTERTRPLSIGTEGLTRSKPEYTSYTTHFPVVNSESTTVIQHQRQRFPSKSLQNCSDRNNSNSNTNLNTNTSQCNNNNLTKSLNQTRRHTIISTTLTNYNTQLAQTEPGLAAPDTVKRRASVAWENNGSATERYPTTQNAYKPVRITLIGDTLKQWNDELLTLQSEKMKMITANRGGFNHERRICTNGHNCSHKPNVDDELATIVKAVPAKIAQIPHHSYHQLNQLNNAVNQKGTNTNANHTNPAVTIV